MHKPFQNAKTNFRFNFKHFKQNKQSVSASINSRELDDVNLNLVIDLYDKLNAETSLVRGLKAKRKNLPGSVEEHTSSEGVLQHLFYLNNN
jgi:hypothetical protein